ncbi:hypothetical protein ABIB08_009062 [Bradyrhizobium sp. RT11b]
MRRRCDRSLAIIATLDVYARAPALAPTPICPRVDLLPFFVFWRKEYLQFSSQSFHVLSRVFRHSVLDEATFVVWVGFSANLHGPLAIEYDSPTAPKHT